MNKNVFARLRVWLSYLPLLLALVWTGGGQAADRPPNIVLIYADDLGYGDVGCNGATLIQTPHIDRIANEGLRFTDGHAAAATCTPSRYALLTGQYAWRKEGTGILPGDASLIIPTDQPTLPKILKRAGYRTGVVGKWHLGLGKGEIDWNAEISPGPREVGFDESFIMAATGDRVPTVYLKDQKVVGLDPSDPIRVSYRQKIGDEPTGKEHPELLTMGLTHGHDQTIVNGISRIGYMSGGKAARWNDESMSDDFAGAAAEFIERNREKPFFLFVATHGIHVPRVPHPRFRGKSPLGPRGDVILELDDLVGKVLGAIDRTELAKNTLVIFTSDNGPVLDDGYADDAVSKNGEHSPSGPWRGGKYTPYEGGTRVPFLVSWPGTIKPGVSDALVSQVDLLTSLGTVSGEALHNQDASDSLDLSPALLGKAGHGRNFLVEQGGPISLRLGSWKYVTRPKMPKAELYNLARDPGEKTNLIDQEVEVARECKALLADIREKSDRRVSSEMSYKIRK